MWLILLDRSSSMGRPFQGGGEFAGRVRKSDATIKLEAAKQAIREHLRGLGSPTRVVLIAFNDEAEIVYNGASNAHVAIDHALDAIEAIGGTSIAAALNLAVATVDGAVQEGLFRALVVTDGEDDLGHALAAATELAKRGVAIDVALIDATRQGEAVARAVAQDGSVSAVTSAEELARGVGNAAAAQDEEHVRVLTMVDEHRLEQEKLDREKPIEERVSFTAAYASDIASERWYPLVVYVHLAKMQEEVARAIREDPVAETNLPNLSVTRAARGIARGTQLTLTPHVEALQFNPPTATVAWFEDIQDVRFRIRAPTEKAGQSVYGAIAVTVGSLPIAHLGIAINVHPAGTSPSAQHHELRPTSIYQNVFASYAHADADVVQACRAVYWGLGIHLAVDRQTLRSGQGWDPKLRKIIKDSNLFQLFWSDAARKSVPVRKEYEFALSLLPRKGEGFVRPLVWESPTPEIPEALRSIHFAPLDLAALRRLSHFPIEKTSSHTASDTRTARARLAVAAIPLVPGASPDVVRAASDDLSDVVHFLEKTSGLRYYPVPTLLVDEHVVKTVRAHETVDIGPSDPRAIELAEALQEYLLAMSLQFHVGKVVPKAQGSSSSEALAAQLGSGKVVTSEQFEWLRRTCEWFPFIRDALALDLRDALRIAGRIRGQPELDLPFAETIAFLLATAADAIERDGADGVAVVGDGSWKALPEPLLRDLIQSSGCMVTSGRELQLKGTRRNFAALLHRLGESLMPLLSTLDQAPDCAGALSAEVERALPLCKLAANIMSSLLSWNTLLRSEARIDQVTQWVQGLVNPAWRKIGETLTRQGLAGDRPMDSLANVLRAFCDRVGQLLDHGLRSGGDFDLTFGYAVPEKGWKRVVDDLGAHGLTIAARPDWLSADKVLLRGRFSDCVALYHRAADRLVSLLSTTRRRSSTQRVFVEMVPTFGIFAPADSESSNQALYRWATEQGIAQALTLPGTDRVLLCLGAAERLVAQLRQGATNRSDAQMWGATFQRCVLVHEHFHAILATGLDAQGLGPAGATLDEWSKARALNESLAVWMELHYVRGNEAMERLVGDYIGAGVYPVWPYAGAQVLEGQFATGGIDRIRSWIQRLRSVPELAQRDFDVIALPSAAPARPAASASRSADAASL